METKCCKLASLLNAIWDPKAFVFCKMPNIFLEKQWVSQLQICFLSKMFENTKKHLETKYRRT